VANQSRELLFPSAYFVTPVRNQTLVGRVLNQLLLNLALMLADPPAERRNFPSQVAVSAHLTSHCNTLAIRTWRLEAGKEKAPAIRLAE
jgi:hypothetical protein